MKPTNHPPMPTGWAWTHTCGWSTGRHEDLAEVEHRRYGHLRWHDHMNLTTERQTA